MNSDNRLKIVHVIFSLSSGGAERVVLNLCNEQSKTHEVVLLTILKDNAENSFYKPQLNQSVKHLNLNSKKGLTLRNFFRTFRILRKENPDIIHYHLNTVLYGFLPALFLKINSIHTLHSVAQLTLGFRGQKYLNRLFYRKKRIIPVALSEECKNSIEVVYGINDSKTILNGVPEAIKTERYNEVEHFVNSLRISPKSLVLIHIARYSPEHKNQELLFSVFNNLIADGYPFNLLVIGRDFPKYNFPNMYFLGEKQNVIDYISCSDALILSSNNEGIPMSVLEGFSCGIPVVSTPAGGMCDILKNKNLGVMSPDFSPKSFRDSILKLNEKITNQEFSKQKIQEIFQNQYSIGKCSDAYLQIYNSI